MKFKYPEARRDDSVAEDYHGVQVADPYRWMENPDTDETKAFVNAQNAVAEPFLEKCAFKEQLHSEIKAMWDHPKYSTPQKSGSKFFYYYNTGLQNQSVMYVQDTLESEPRVFLDPNLLSEDGTTAVKHATFSEDGNYHAYSISKAGSDWVTIKVRDVSTGEDLPDILERAKFTSLSWTHDHKGFFYNRYKLSDSKQDGTETEANLHQKLYYHLLGTDQSDDVLCAEWPENPKWMTWVEVSHCGRYVVMGITEGCAPVNRLYYCDLESLPDGIKGILPCVKVVDNFDAEYDYITNEGSVFTFKTNLKAPKYKLINIDLNNHAMENWKDLIEENAKDVLEWVSCVNNDKLVVHYLHDVKSAMYYYDLVTGQQMAEFPLEIGTVVGYSGKKKQKEIFYHFKSFLTPGVIYRCDLSEDKLNPKEYRQVEVKGFDASEFEQKQVFFTSKDGTKIPMFIVHKKGIVLDSSHPVMLYGYGGFNVSIAPYFSVSRVVFMSKLGGIFASANIRGGGEYGETWHKDGILLKKQNGFDDFIAAAEYLIDNKYTNPNKLTINGGSNGGLLVAACANQRPELYGCVIPQVGVLDMLRFHKFTIGHAWTTDFGCSENGNEFEYIYKYSPLHNIKKLEDGKQYPAMLLFTADHDDRVVPLHSLKFIAQLQHTVGSSESQKNPLLIKIDTKAGHGAGKPTSKVIEDVTDLYSFIAINCNLEWQK